VIGRTRYLAIPCIFAAALIFNGVTAAEDLAARRARALALMDAAVRADAEAIAQARADFSAVLRANPDDAVARVHRGWLLVLSARTAPLDKAQALADEGCAEMDAAVAAAPENMTVRFVRARSDYQVPLVLEREGRAEADFAVLVAAARGAPGQARLPAYLRRGIFFHAGAFALKRGRASEATALLEEAAGAPADEPSDGEVQSMLALARRASSSPTHGEDPHRDKSEQGDQSPRAAP